MCYVSILRNMAIISLNCTKKVVLVMNTYRFYCGVGTSYIVFLNFVLESDEWMKYENPNLSKIL